MAAAMAFRPLYCAPLSAHPKKSSTISNCLPKSSTLAPFSPTLSAKKKHFMPQVLVPVGFGTEEMEAVILVDVLRRAGADVLMASVERKLKIEGSSGTKLVSDTLISSCSEATFDLVALPGGMPGSARLRDCEILQTITSKQVKEKKLYGAICAAPAVVLEPWGLMKRKKMTCHPSFMHKLPTFWAVKSNLQVSGELTTSRGPGTAFEFALSFVEQLFGSQLAEEIGATLLMHSDCGQTRKEEFNEVDWSLDHTPRVLVPVANGSEEMEVVMIVDILRRARVDVVVASVERSMQIVASRNTKIVADKSISAAAAESVYDLIILPGGVTGAERLYKSKLLKKLLQEQKLAGRIYGAICSSITILQKQGLIEDKRVAAHPSVVNQLANQVVDGAGVVIDGKLITSRGLRTAMDFAFAIVSKLFGHTRARGIAEGIVFNY